MRYEVRSLGLWTDPVTEARRSRWTFKAPWGSTLKLLGYEMQMLGWGDYGHAGGCDCCRYSS